MALEQVGTQDKEATIWGGDKKLQSSRFQQQ